MNAQLKYLLETIEGLRLEPALSSQRVTAASKGQDLLEARQPIRTTFLADRKMLRGMLKTKFGNGYLASEGEVKGVQISMSQVGCQ